jgi:hypothetical protein
MIRLGSGLLGIGRGTWSLRYPVSIGPTRRPGPVAGGRRPARRPVEREDGVRLGPNSGDRHGRASIARARMPSVGSDIPRLGDQRAGGRRQVDLASARRENMAGEPVSRRSRRRASSSRGWDFAAGPASIVSGLLDEYFLATDGREAGPPILERAPEVFVAEDQDPKGLSASGFTLWRLSPARLGGLDLEREASRLARQGARLCGSPGVALDVAGALAPEASPVCRGLGFEVVGARPCSFLSSRPARLPGEFVLRRPSRP